MISAAGVPSAAVADAAVRLEKGFRAAPIGIRRLLSGQPVIGPALPCRHYGSVDVFLEALDSASPGDILVISDQGRRDRGCIGDLAVAEFLLAGIAGVVLWGSHRDSAQLLSMPMPVWSLGAAPAGPTGGQDRPSDQFDNVRLGTTTVVRGDIVVADDDGVLITSRDEWPDLAREAQRILATERAQAEALARGVSLREQLRFAEYLALREQDARYDFREHLRRVGGAIET